MNESDTSGYYFVSRERLRSQQRKREEPENLKLERDFSR